LVAKKELAAMGLIATNTSKDAILSPISSPAWRGPQEANVGHERDRFRCSGIVSQEIGKIIRSLLASRLCLLHLLKPTPVLWVESLPGRIRFGERSYPNREQQPA
jgi:hypothetical protein